MSDHAEGHVDVAVIERALRARALLGQPAVIEAFEAVMADLRDQIVAQVPDARDRRESLFHQHLGLQLVLGQLKAWETQTGDQRALAQE